MSDSITRMISLIVAYDKNGVIGNGPDIPWHLPADFAYFKSVTQGSAVIMGRTTYESIGRPLPARQNIVVTRNNNYEADGVEVAHSVEDAIKRAESSEVFIIGGTQIYRYALENNLVQRAYVTHIDAEVEGDVLFPKEMINDWIRVNTESKSADEKNAYAMEMSVYEKNVIVDGKKLAQEREEKLKKGFENKETRLDIIVASENGATKTYVKKKRELAERVGVEFVEHSFSSDVTESSLISKIQEIQTETDGIVVQLPLPSHVDTEFVCSHIPTTKDPDLLNKKSMGLFLHGSSEIMPPVVKSIDIMREHYDLDFKDRKALVIGKGKLVGGPAIAYLEQQGTKVTAVEKQDGDFNEISKTADIIISGAGVSDLVTSKMIREGVQLFDGGTSGSSGSIRGDIDWACAEKAKLFSRSPGGIGPLTVVALFENLLTLKNKA